MRSDQRLTTGDVEAVAGQVLGRVVGARLLKERDRNQVFAVGEEAILKAYLRDGAAKQARKVATLRFLEGQGSRGGSQTTNRLHTPRRSYSKRG